ncbi:phosphonate ABC transporter, permease protein PhnE [Rhodococcus sp. SMB37]|uniref:phosphonate ABC transporter, permease protein PhnE n=1 Tax=Rhodococcus sp. SMB37 TaxID=2512213 RepID=UPI00104CAD76|nr:phosphonate ABC transporter, permease protein PhnE [Rhodococcus sp. SMB37]
MIVLVVAGVWSVDSLGINLATIARSLDNGVAFIQRMFPLDFPPVAETVSLIFETLAIVFLATFLAVVLSVPLALAAAKATTRGRLSQGTARTPIVLARAVPDLVLAIVFLRMFGLGATAGILAMGIHSVGMVGKLYADAIEELDDGPRESIESAGGSRGQQIFSAIPQVLLPQIVATALHRFDINLRTSVLLGYVGVGGIGLAIADALRTLDYQRGMALALLVLILCIAVELLSGAIRAAIMKRSGGAVVGGTWSDRLFNRGAAGLSGDLRLTPPWTAARVRRFMSGGAIVVLLVASLWRVDISMGALWDGLLALPDTLGLFLPPSTGGALGTLVEQLLVTVQIALAATFIGAVLAIPIGILAANNVVANKAVRSFFRMLIVVVRGIPELILAIIFVVVSGLGAVAGTLALAVGAVGLLSKLVADSLEETDTDVQDALRTAGASEIQVFFGATLRQSAPAFIAHTMYLLDSNIRSATLLGVVGAGGIGFLLLNASRVNQFDVVTTILILMVAVVLAVEALSMWLRKVVR